MELETITNVKQDGEFWFVYVDDHRIGSGCRDKHAAEVLARWFYSSAQDIVDWVADLLDRGWKDREKEKAGG